MAIMLRPGQEFKDFDILEKKTTKSKAGSVGRSLAFEKVGFLKGVMTATSPKETEFWKQRGHEVSNKIVQQYGQKAEKGQFLQRVNAVTGETNTYYIEAVRNPGGLDHFTVYLVNERDDLKYEPAIGTDSSGESED